MDHPPRLKCSSRPLGYLVHLDGVGGHKLGPVDLAIRPSDLNHVAFSRRPQLETVLTLQRGQRRQ